MDILRLIRGILSILLICRLVNKTQDDEKNEEDPNSAPSDDNCDCLNFSDDDFIILNNKLIAYVGKGRDVVVPEGVTEIAENVFENRCFDNLKLPSALEVFHPQKDLYVNELDLSETNLKSVRLGDFENARFISIKLPTCQNNVKVSTHANVSYPDDFLVLNNKLIAYVGKSIDIIVPEGIQEIKTNAFREQNVGRIVVPSSVRVFECQTNLTVCKLDLRKSGLTKVILGVHCSVMELDLPSM